jgi:hypothetical protein
MLNIAKIPANIMRDIVDGLEFSGPGCVSTLSPREALDALLKTHGIIGFTNLIIGAWETLRAAEIQPTAAPLSDEEYFTRLVKQYQPEPPIPADNVAVIDGLLDAFDIVLGLARENIIDPRSCNEEEIQDEAARQSAAIEMVEKHAESYRGIF